MNIRTVQNKSKDNGCAVDKENVGCPCRIADVTLCAYALTRDFDMLFLYALTLAFSLFFSFIFTMGLTVQSRCGGDGSEFQPRDISESSFGEFGKIDAPRVGESDLDHAVRIFGLKRAIHMLALSRRISAASGSDSRSCMITAMPLQATVVAQSTVQAISSLSEGVKIHASTLLDGIKWDLDAEGWHWPIDQYDPL